MSIRSGGDSVSRQRRLVLALGSGGMRGFAHVGVMRILLAAGMRIDAICGASAGALFGALYAMHGSLESLGDVLTVSPREIWRFYGDRLRLAPSNPLGARLAQRFAGLRLESLAVPMSVLAVDLQSGEEVVLQQGSLRRAVEASIAIPVLARPVVVGGRQLIDGGYGPRGPAAAARAMDGDVVVYVDLGVRPLCPEPAGVWLRRALRRLRSRRWSREGTGSVMHRSLEVLTTGSGNAPGADLVIEPSLHGIDPNFPFSAAAALQRGEVAARRALPRLAALLDPQQTPA